jgi:DNA-binding transcriptional ArsR family regulator
MADIYHALAAEVRRIILDELQERGGQSLYEICSRLIMKHGISLSRQAISQHLDVLEKADLISTKRDGKYKFHYFNSEPLNQIAKRWPTQTKKEKDDED